MSSLIGMLVNVGRLALAGLVATGAMVVLMELLPLAGFPRVDVPAIIAEQGFGSRSGVALAAGWASHLLLGGLVFPLILSVLSRRFWPCGNAIMKGGLLAMALFVGGEGVAIPLTGGGFFSSHAAQPGPTVLQDFLAHSLYGLLLGLLARRELQSSH